MALRAARLLLAQIYDLVKHDMSVSAVSLKGFIVLSTVNSTPFFDHVCIRLLHQENSKREQVLRSLAGQCHWQLNG